MLPTVVTLCRDILALCASEVWAEPILIAGDADLLVGGVAGRIMCGMTFRICPGKFKAVACIDVGRVCRCIFTEEPDLT